MAVPQSNGKSAALEPRRQIHDAEHSHTICGDRVFFPDYSDLPEAEGFDEFLNHLDVRNGFVCCCRLWRGALPIIAPESAFRHSTTTS